MVISHNIDLLADALKHAGLHHKTVATRIAKVVAPSELVDFVRRQDAVGLQTFRMLSIRSLLAFGMLSSWAGALYLQRGASSWLAILYAVLWGSAGMLVVGLFFWLLPRLSEEGTAQLGTAVGRTGQVYMDIPKDGVGQVRILVGNTIKFVKARSVSGEDLPAGTAVRAVKTLDSVTLEVERVES